MITKSSKKKIYIPDRVKKLKISSLPISDTLSEYFNEHRIYIIGDLENLTAFVEIVSSRRKPFTELRHYILAIQETANDRVIFVPKQDSARTVNQERNRATQHQKDYESILAKTILIPSTAHKWKISILPISNQLVEKIKSSGCSKLYDLHRVKYKKFSKLKSFEKSDVIQLYAFITQLQSKKTYPSIEAVIAKSYPEEEIKDVSKISSKIVCEDKLDHDFQTQDIEALKRTVQSKYKSTETIPIPRSLVKFLIGDLSPSDNLGNLLKKAKIYKIGHLRGITYYDLEHQIKLTAEDIAELQDLIEFAKQYAKYTMFRTGFETIKKAALKRRENAQ